MNGLAARLETGRWQEHVEKIAERARDNDIDASALVAMGDDSADALLAFFPRAVQADHRAALVQAIESASALIDPVFDCDQNHTRLSGAPAGRAQRAARRRLSVVGVGVAQYQDGREKKRRRSGAGTRRRIHVRGACRISRRHPSLHQGIYAIAAKTLGRAQALKTERGLIDFSDMEQLTLARRGQSARARMPAKTNSTCCWSTNSRTPIPCSLHCSSNSRAWRSG